MGDAGPPTPPASAAQQIFELDGARQREVTVLVTGFGVSLSLSSSFSYLHGSSPVPQPFKSFHLNPSFLIAQRLPAILLPASPSAPLVRILCHPVPLRVSYPTVAATVPQLLAQYGDPDYVFHIGMAGGRDFYALETLAQRDGYRIRDVDGRDGYLDGEARWRAQGLPESLGVKWDVGDVDGRWGGEMERAEKELGIGEQGRAKVRMSEDAGRFLCDFVFFETLSRRVGGAREGKVCFLHVPGETDEGSVRRGTRVAEAAIRSVVGSWEEGYRRKGLIGEGEDVGPRRVGLGFFA